MNSRLEFRFSPGGTKALSHSTIETRSLTHTASFRIKPAYPLRINRKADLNLRGSLLERSSGRGAGHAIEDVFRLGAVLGHLRGKRLHGTEFQIRANEADELDLHGLSVQIAIEIEQEGLEQGKARVEGRPRAKISRALQLSSFKIRVHGVDAVLQGDALLKTNVGGRVSHNHTAPRTSHNDA